MGEPPHIQTSERHTKQVIVGCVVVALLGSAVALYLFDPARGGYYPRCILHMTTGLDCPGCGGLRAAHQLLHGNIAAAFRLNPLVITLLPFAVVFAVLAALKKIRGRPARNLLQHPVVGWSIAIVVIAFGVLRNLPWQRWFS